MPFYNDLRKNLNKQKSYSLIFPEWYVANEFDGTVDEKDKERIQEDKTRTINNLLSLRKGLEEIPSKKADKNLLIASWNIRAFGQSENRLPEAFYYIAEIISRFDITAIQEVTGSLRGLEIVMKILGSDYKYMLNDVTGGTKGNSERSVYIYNDKRVKLSGLSGEITFWDNLVKNSNVKFLYRTPYITGFKAGWKKFSIINLHLRPGDKKADFAHRLEAMQLLVKVIKDRIASKKFWNENIILLGDMNLYSPTSRSTKDGPLIDFLDKKKFCQIDALTKEGTNLKQDEIYDRMFFLKDDYFQIAKDANDEEKGGVFNPYDHILKKKDDVDKITTYKNIIKAKTHLTDYNVRTKTGRQNYYIDEFRKMQLSDHLPIWAEIDIDSSDIFLKDQLSDDTT